MMRCIAPLAALCVVVPLYAAPTVAAEPAPPPPPAGDAAPPPPPPPPNTGAVPSGPPGIVHTPDGWELNVAASNESQLPVAPLTTAVSSREYLVGATFTGSVKGDGSTTLGGGTLETGFQIGCGIAMDKIKLNGSVGLGTSGSRFAGGLVPTGLTVPIQGQIEVEPRPGEVISVLVDKKSFKATEARVTVKDVHIKIDNCVGQSFLRSYAILTSTTTDTDDVVAYYGVTKVV